MTAAPACKICGHPVVFARNHDIRALRSAKMFPVKTCKCGKLARVRCFNGVGTYWVECEDGHGMGRPA
jgi:RNase P subunit RPR2